MSNIKKLIKVADKIQSKLQKLADERLYGEHSALIFGAGNINFEILGLRGTLKLASHIIDMFLLDPIRALYYPPEDFDLEDKLGSCLSNLKTLDSPLASKDIMAATEELEKIVDIIKTAKITLGDIADEGEIPDENEIAKFFDVSQLRLINANFKKIIKQIWAKINHRHNRARELAKERRERELKGQEDLEMPKKPERDFSFPPIGGKKSLNSSKLNKKW